MEKTLSTILRRIEVRAYLNKLLPNTQYKTYCEITDNWNYTPDKYEVFKQMVNPTGLDRVPAITIYAVIANNNGVSLYDTINSLCTDGSVDKSIELTVYICYNRDSIKFNIALEDFINAYYSISHNINLLIVCDDTDGELMNQYNERVAYHTNINTEELEEESTIINIYNVYVYNKEPLNYSPEVDDIVRLNRLLSIEKSKASIDSIVIGSLLYSYKLRWSGVARLNIDICYRPPIINNLIDSTPDDESNNNSKMNIIDHIVNYEDITHTTLYNKLIDRISYNNIKDTVFAKKIKTSDIYSGSPIKIYSVLSNWDMSYKAALADIDNCKDLVVTAYICYEKYLSSCDMRLSSFVRLYNMIMDSKQKVTIHVYDSIIHDDVDNDDLTINIWNVIINSKPFFDLEYNHNMPLSINPSLSLSPLSSHDDNMSLYSLRSYYIRNGKLRINNIIDVQLIIHPLPIDYPVELSTIIEPNNNDSEIRNNMTRTISGFSESGVYNYINMLYQIHNDNGSVYISKLGLNGSTINSLCAITLINEVGDSQESLLCPVIQYTNRISIAVNYDHNLYNHSADLCVMDHVDKTMDIERYKIESLCKIYNFHHHVKLFTHDNPLEYTIINTDQYSLIRKPSIVNYDTISNELIKYKIDDLPLLTIAIPDAPIVLIPFKKKDDKYMVKIIHAQESFYSQYTPDIQCMTIDDIVDLTKIPMKKVKKIVKKTIKHYNNL